jgi:hypothetical protein
VLVGEWGALRNAIIAQFNLPADPSTKDLARLYYLPSAPDGGYAFSGQVGDTPINVDQVLGEARAVALTARAEQLVASASTAALAASQSAEPVDLAAVRQLLAGSKGRNADLLRKICRGEPFADRGARDNTLNAACAAARFACPPTTPTEAILSIFRESVSKIELEENETHQQWLDTCREKLDRQLERRIAHDAARRAEQEEVRARLRIEASKSGATPAPRESESRPQQDSPGSSDDAEEPAAPVGPYSEADLADWAKEHKCGDVLDFQRRWIITKGNAHYIFAEGRYLAPIPRENLEHSIVRDLSRAPVALFGLDGKGNQRMREVRAILHDYSTVARAIEASLSLQTSFYEPTAQTFFEAACPLRKVRAVRHDDVDLWLWRLDPTGKLREWVAAVSRLDRQACAVYLDGAKGVGKGLLASGLARLWTTGGPSEIARVLDGFNESLINCPLIFADESLPARKGITAELRRLIGSSKRTLNRKFLPAAPLEGAIRLIIAGNNDRLLDTGEELSSNDLEAVAERIYYLRADRAAADYLAALGGPLYLARWVDGDWIAEHSLWLRENLALNETSRFLVEGNPSEFHRHLATGAGMAGLVCEWLCRYLADVSAPPSQLLAVGRGEVWVNTEALAKESAWNRYVPATKVPSAQSIGRALRSLAHASGSIGPISYHRIKAELLLGWVSRLQIGDQGAISRKLNADNTAMGVV